MAGLVYLLCAATALGCAALLWRSYLRQRVRLLFWSSVCFLGLTVENIMLYVDQIKFPDVDLSIYQQLVGLAAFLSLIYALIFDDR